MKVKRLTDKDYASGGAFLLALFSDPKENKIETVFENDQRKALSEDFVKSINTRYVIPDEWEYVEVNTQRLVKAKLSPLYFINNMWFGTRLNMISDRMPSRDIVPVTIAIYKMLVKKSPRQKGFYKNNHEIYLDTVPFRGNTSKLTESSVMQITNRVEYASTLESPHWPKTYQKVFTWAKRKFGKDWDLRLEFGSPGGVLGDNIFKKTPFRKNGTRKYYQYPVLTIAPLNTLPFANNFVYFKRRSRKQRRARPR